MSFASATLDAHGLLAALRGGLAQLERNADLLDALNVFPVPDGDTGSNMVHTLRAGLVALDGRDGAPVSLTALADRLRPRLLAESRGNSGFLVATFLVILVSELLPKSLAIRYAEACALATASGAAGCMAWRSGSP